MEFEAYDIALVPVIVGFVHVLRLAGVPARFLPICAVLLGIGSGFMYIAPDDPRKALLAGTVLGLSAIGAWSGVRNTMNGKDSNPK